MLKAHCFYIKVNSQIKSKLCRLDFEGPLTRQNDASPFWQKKTVKAVPSKVQYWISKKNLASDKLLGADK
jgi:hypothetical protein